MTDRLPMSLRALAASNVAIAGAVIGLLLPVIPGPLLAADATEDPAMFGGHPTRNMVSSETGLPTSWDPDDGTNIVWTAQLGSQTYAGPVAWGDRIVVGTNNQARRNEAIDGDRGNVMVFDRATGEFLWQAAHPKLSAGPVNDWPLQGVCSTPYIDNGIIYYVSNRAEIIAADLDGFRDGSNDGAFTAEAAKGETDEDVLWKYDMIGELDVFPHNLAAGSPLIIDGILYTHTGNGVDESHLNLPSPFSPSFVALDAKTGELVWESAEPGEHILHGSWSNPSYAVMGGKPQVIFPGGDGWVYSLDPKTGDLIWKFDANPKDSVWELGGAGTRNNLISMATIVGDRIYIGVGQDPEHGEGEGHFYAIDATLEGDITDKGAIWHRGGEDIHRTISTAAVSDGIVYISDFSGFLYALDAETGEEYWRYDTFAAVWGSPFVADGKVYLGDEDGDIAILEASKTKKLLGEINMGSAVYTTPIAKDGTLYIASRTKLFAIKNGAGAKPTEESKPADEETETSETTETTAESNKAGSSKAG